MAGDKVVYLTRLWTRTYRNKELGEWIDAVFPTPEERTAAWRMAFRIGEMYPEVKDKIRGELIDEDIQEES